MSVPDALTVRQRAISRAYASKTDELCEAIIAKLIGDIRVQDLKMTANPVRVWFDGEKMRSEEIADWYIGGDLLNTPRAE